MKRQSLGARIAQARRQLGVREHRDVTQIDLAAAVGVSAATLSRWEADLAVPRDDTFVKLATYLGVDPGFLRFGPTPAAPERAPAELPPMDMGEDGRVWAANERKRKATREGGQTKKRRA